MRQSIATLSAPEFINLQPLDINPLMSKCEIKVLYTGKNRNKSFITKEVATEMAKTLRGAPIVGYYKNEKEDFDDHGERLTFDSDGLHVDCYTVPYGFVSPDAQVWFKEFEDTDEFGNVTLRLYMMTTGYIWDGQFKEAKRVTEKGNNQSMELDKDSVQGNWTEDVKEQMEFFIINDAIFSKLCILGEDVEPCFEGASITSPQVSTSFTIDDNWKKSLFDMMQQLQFALQGGQSMSVESTIINENIETVEEVVETAVEDSVAEEETPVTAEFKKEDEEEKKDESEEKEESSDDKEEAEAPAEEKKDDEDEKKKYSLLVDQYSALQEQYDSLKANFDELTKVNAELSNFKLQVENEKKDELLNTTFAILSVEDKKELIDNKEKYSYEDLEKELSLICFRKKVNFNLEDNSENEVTTEAVVTTFNLDNSAVEASMPAWLKAVQATQNSRQF